MGQSTAPAIAVVIPAFNPGDFLRTALDSVIAQTCTDWECVVVDDGSTEDLAWVADHHPRVRLVRQSNQGVSAARNTGVLNTSNPLIAFLDADDLWCANKLERQRSVMRAEVDFSATSFYRFNNIEQYPGWPPGDLSWSGLLQGNSICTSTVMVRRCAFERAGGFTEGLQGAEDWDLWLRLARNGPGVAVQEVLTGYRVHASQTSRQLVLMWGLALRVLCKQRGPLGPTLRGLRRVGQIYGSQVFDSFRVSRSLPELAWATLMWPDYVVQTLARTAIDRVRRRRKATHDPGS